MVLMKTLVLALKVLLTAIMKRISTKQILTQSQIVEYVEFSLKSVPKLFI